MGKFRSKLKRHSKGKHWARGQSATSNPENKKHRNKARSRFFQPDLSLAPAPAKSGVTPLTLEAVTKHEYRLAYANGKDGKNETTVNDIAASLKSFDLSNDNATESQGGSFKTFQTFASNYSSCSNMTFNKFLSGFRQTSELHKEMLAILSAITEVIKERKGTESSAEYFLALLETLDGAKQNEEIIASISLLSMVIKTVPQAVLRKKFSECGPVLLSLLEQFSESENQNIVRSIIGCLSVLLRAQEYSSWSAPTQLKMVNHMLTFTIHTRPKVRKAAQHAVASIIHGSCFMVTETEPKENGETDISEQSDAHSAVPYHPASSLLTKFCLAQFKPENVTKSHAVVLHTLSLLKDTIYGLKGDDIREICENLLSIMTAAKVIVQTNCFQILHSLFASKSKNLTSSLIGKLIAAVYDYRPDRSDMRQTLAWLAVLKEGHICLGSFDLTMCINALPRFIDICAGDIWMSDNSQIAAGVSNTIKELLLDCVKPCCESEQTALAHKKPINRIINAISGALSAPFGHVSQQVLLVFKSAFEVAGVHFKDVLQKPLNAIAARYDENASSRVQIEHTIAAAISTMGPDAALQAVSLVDDKGALKLSSTWVLPLLRESIDRSSLTYFSQHIIPLANSCQENWKRYKTEENIALAHTYELLYCQLWGLFPGFCRNPTDINKFGTIAKTLGDALQSKVEIRMPILDGLKELLSNANDECKQQLKKFSKNFLKRLLNIYSTKPTGSYENDIRANAMEVIREYLKITPKETFVELFETAKSKFKSMELIETVSTKIQKLNESLERDSESEEMQTDDGHSSQEAYDVLQNLLRGENALGVEYVNGNEEEIKEYLKQVPPKRLNQLFKNVKTSLSAFAYEAYFDILECLAVYQPVDQLKELFDEYISLTLRNAKTGGITHLIKERQLKSYKLLQNILLSENDGCVKFVTQHKKEIQKVLLATMQNRKNACHATRLNCLLILIETEGDNIKCDNKLVSKTIPEIVMGFNCVPTKQRDSTVKLLLRVGEIYEKENRLNELVDILMAGFGGDSALVTSTIHVLRIILHKFVGSLTLNTVTFMLEQILAFVVCRSRPEVDASMLFLIVFLKILPASYVANHLPDIVKSLSAMVPDTKRHCRLNLGYIYKQLCKRFTAEEIIKLVPGNDEVTHKKLKNIRKALARQKRAKAINEKATADENDEDEEIDLKKKSYTIDDILADSDSELENDILMDSEDKKESKQKVNRSKEQKYIREDEDTIVDLADVNAMNKITSSKPSKNKENSSEAKKTPKEKNRGFRMAEDGRLIIEEPKKGKGQTNSESDSDGDSDDEQNKKVGDLSVSDDDSDNNEEMENRETFLKNRKRKASTSISMASGKTGTSSKYVTGGKGIHRSLDAESMRSGHTQKTAASTKSSAYGSKYRSKKGHGDVKKKGGLDPFAYIPLSRSNLNKRKTAKNKGQFKSIVTGARKGAAAGSKNKRMKTG